MLRLLKRSAAFLGAEAVGPSPWHRLSGNN
jgi:hypothetical protein